jgi:outer membrane protein OmpA-like peptidoglycan-associated protein
MKTTRPVFESFSAFVSFINEAEGDESMTIDSFLSSNSSFFDDAAQKGFDALKIAATRAPLVTGEELQKTASGVLGAMNSVIKEFIAGNKETSGKQNIRLVGKTTTEVKKFVYPALINGKVDLTADIYSPFSPELRKKANLQGGSRANLNDLLTAINLNNLNSSGDMPIPAYKKTWYPNKDSNGKAMNDYISDSGAADQQIISSIDSGIDFGNNAGAYPGDQAPIITELDFTMKNAGKIDDEKAYRTFVLYGVGNIVQGAGNSMPATLIKKDFTTITIPGKSTPYQVPIDGGDAMFEQGSAKINTKNKEAIDKMLTAALAPLAGKPESIVITGGASYEPDGQGPINKKLVVDRANAVKTYLETLYPELKDLITVNDKDFSKIQAKDEKDKYTEFRKVYLDITGVLQGASYKENKDIEYLVDGVIKADTVEIIQYAITFEFYKVEGDN